MERRTFLTVLSTAAAAIGQQACGSCPYVDAGRVEQFREGTLAFVKGASAIVGRDAGGFYAMTSICTHRGCDISLEGHITELGLECGCHGSQFDFNGEVLKGPASSELDHVEVLIDNGRVIVHSAQKVEKSLRVKPT